MPFVYTGLDVKKAIEIHKTVFVKSEAERGIENPQIIVDSGKVESVLFHLQNDDYYPTFTEKVAHIVYGINKNHAFNNGNKRASLAISVFFLQLNDHDKFVYQYQQGMQEVLIWVAKSYVSKSQLERIIEFLLYGNIHDIMYFISQAREYREFIEPENAKISASLLSKMINEWIDEDFELSDNTITEILEAIGEF